MLRDASATQGELPKIMAAYNAGLTPVTRWNTEVNDEDDPLLYMESIPYWETRSYVAIVMRNYWMYERQADGAIAPAAVRWRENDWPDLPRRRARRRRPRLPEPRMRRTAWRSTKAASSSRSTSPC